MKKSILTLAIATLTVLGISQSVFAGNADREAVTVLTEISNINNIEVHGNVELYLSTGTTDQVKVYNKYYSENALVQSQNGVLKISSYKAQKLVIWITVSNLNKLSVYDNAEVRSFGKLSAIELNVNLYDHAAARLNIDAFAISMKLKDRAAADLEGSVIEGELNSDYSAALNVSNLNSENLVKKVTLFNPTDSQKNSLVEI